MNFLNPQPGNVLPRQPFTPSTPEFVAAPPNPFAQNPAPVFNPNMTPHQHHYQQQQWCQNIPTVMPWTGMGPCQPSVSGTAAFAFTSIPSPVSVPLACDTTEMREAVPNPNINPTTTLANSRLKRPFNPNEANMTEFDFENDRPLKKYICDDKVLEIFDRLHIREGEQYIVEDSIERKSMNQTSSVHIEEILDGSAAETVLEFSPELQEAFKNSSSAGITEKILQAERERLDKAVVLWHPNKSLLDLAGKDDEDDDEDGTKAAEKNRCTIEIEEVFSDDDEEMTTINYNNQDPNGDTLTRSYLDADLLME